MSDSSSDSDCFESADEEFKDENISDYDNLKYSQLKYDCGRNNSLISVGNNERSKSRESNTESYVSECKMEYRKRPERRKNMLKADTANANRMSLSDQNVKSQGVKTDMLIQGITANLSKNLNVGFSKIQQTSNSIKDLVISSLPVKTPIKHSSKYSYKYEDKEEDGDEKEIACYIPEYKHEFVQNKFDEETSSLFDIYFQESVKSEEKELQPTQGSKNETESAAEIGDSDDNTCQDMNLVSDIADKESMPQETIRNVIKDDIEESEDSNCSAETSEFYSGVKKKINENISDLALNVKTEENLLKESDQLKGDKLENVLKEELEELKKPKEEMYDNFMLESADIENNQKETTDGNNDEWGSFELQLEEPDVKVSSEISSVEKKSIKEDFISAESEIADTSLRNLASSSNEGWDDFDFDDDDVDVSGDGKEEVEEEELEEEKLSDVTTEVKPKPLEKYEENEISKSEVSANCLKFAVDETENVYNNNKWTGWDNFGEKQETKRKSGWTLSNWGVNALLNTATSVTQGLSTVLEAGLGAPDPETLAKIEMESMADNNKEKNLKKENLPSTKPEEPTSSNIKLFPDFGITNLVAGVTKNIVEHTKVHEIGSKVISGGLDTLESFGKKTMEVLQEGDPGLKKKRALLLGNKPTLSHVLREAKVKAEMENKKMEQLKLAKLCHFETLFDDFQGLIHLEALEMLSRQCELKLEQLKDSLSGKEFEDMYDILSEVKELCIIDEDELKSNYCGIFDFKISLTKGTESLKNEISIQKIIQVHEDFNVWYKSEKGNVTSSISLFEKALSVLAELTAATVQQFHKGGELLSVKEHRKTVEEADALIQMTGIVCCEIDRITEKFLNLCSCDEPGIDVNIEKKIKEVSANATFYIKDAFNLLIPVLQLGATT